MRVVIWIFLWLHTSWLGAQVTVPGAKNLDMQFDSKSEITSVWREVAAEASKVRVFIGGENHNEVTFNSLMEYGFMNRLHKYAGYRHYVLELSPARGYYLNRYVRYADTHARDALKGISSPKYMNLFENLFRWNQALDSADRIWIHGIDVERFDDLSMLRLADVFRQMREIKQPPTVIAAWVLAVEDRAYRDYKTRLNRFNRKVAEIQSDPMLDEVYDEEEEEADNFTQLNKARLIDTLQQFDTQLKEWLGVDYPSYLVALQGVKEREKWSELSGSADRYHWRELTMYQRFQKLLIDHPDGRFFGQFGRCHISETISDKDCGWYQYESVINQLIKQYFGSPDSVITVGYFYRDRQSEVTAATADKQELLNEELAALFNPVRDGIILFDLNEPPSNLRELRKKYRYVLVNNAKDPTIAEEMPDKTYLDEDDLSPQWEVYMPFFGFNYWQLDWNPWQRHSAQYGRDFSPRPVFGAQHQLMLKYGKALIGFSGYYTYNQNNNVEMSVLSDSAGSVFYKHWGLDFLTGWQWQSGPFQLDFMARIGTTTANFTYVQQVKNLSNAAVYNGLNISNISWNAGIQTSLYYRAVSNIGLGLVGTWYQNIGHGNWYYQKTNQLYRPLGTSSAMTGWSLSLQCALFFEN